MQIPASCRALTIGVHFEYANALYKGDRLALLSHFSTHGSLGPSHAVAGVIALRPTACVLKLTSIHGELVGLAPAGMAA